MKEIGGYFELELARGVEYHKKAIKLNSGRNAFKYILISQDITKVYIPSFICDTMLEPLRKLNIKFEFYNINKNFELSRKLKPKRNEKLIYINYYGIKSNYIKKLVIKYGEKLIIDNTHAFFEKPFKNIDTIYSPRKYFGVRDGGYLYTKYMLNEKLEVDTSLDYIKQLIGRIEKSASEFYSDYKTSEKKLSNQPIKVMSNFTKRVLRSIDYNDVKRTRKINFEFLHKELHNKNLIKIDKDMFSTFVYPFIPVDLGIREKLISKKIYIAKYWNEVINRRQATQIEKDFVNKIIPIPIDQRYSLKDMKRIVNIIKENL